MRRHAKNPIWINENHKIVELLHSNGICHIYKAYYFPSAELVTLKVYIWKEHFHPTRAFTP